MSIAKEKGLKGTFGSNSTENIIFIETQISIDFYHASPKGKNAKKIRIIKSMVPYMLTVIRVEFERFAVFY